MTRGLRSAVVFLLLVAVHVGARPLLPWKAAPDFLVIALLLAAVRLRPGLAAVLGLSLGFAADALSAGSFGAVALAFTVTGFAASWLKAVFFADNVAINAVFFFAGKWVADAVHLVAQLQAPTADLAVQLLVWSPLAGAATALAGVLLLVLLRPVLDPQVV